MIAGAVAAGLWLSRARLMAALATVFALLIAFAVVYAGIAYPGDALGRPAARGVRDPRALPVCDRVAARRWLHASRAVAAEVPRRRGPPRAARRSGPGRAPGARRRERCRSHPGRTRSACRPHPAAETRVPPDAAGTPPAHGATPATPGATQAGHRPIAARSSRHAGVAQMEAQATCNRQVVGSSPTTGSAKGPG